MSTSHSNSSSRSYGHVLTDTPKQPYPGSGSRQRSSAAFPGVAGSPSPPNPIITARPLPPLGAAVPSLATRAAPSAFLPAARASAAAQRRVPLPHTRRWADPDPLGRPLPVPPPPPPPPLHRHTIVESRGRSFTPADAAAAARVRDVTQR